MATPTSKWRAPRIRVVPLVVPLVSLVATWSSSAAAQDAATAEALFEEGRSLVQQQQYEKACPKFAESQRLGPASGTLLNLGECYAKLGKTASAWAAFKEAIPAAHSAGQADREQFAHERVAEIEKTLVRLSVDVTKPAAPQLVVKRDGVVLGEAAWGTAVPVDPGAHVIEASAPGKTTWKTTVEVRSAPSTSVVVPALEAAPDEAGSDGSKSLLTQRNIGIGVAGLGVVAAGLGAVFGLNAISTNDSAKSHCRNGNLCDPTGLDELDSARSKATLSTVFFVAGAAAIGAGAYLFFTAPKVEIAPAVSASSGGLQLRGAW
jgi:tetratricopeptide (TPR) repeat protein